MTLARLEDLVRSVAEKQGLCVTKIDVKPGKKKGDGFLSDIHLVSATSDDGGRLALAVKSAIENQAVVEKFHIGEIFENEEQFYSRIYPTLLRYQDEKHVADPFQAVARYYGSVFDGNIRLLALEDLRSRGFKLFDKKATLDGDHVEKVFTEYGKLHAVSYSYKLDHRTHFDGITDNLHDCLKFFTEGSNFKEVFNETYRVAGGALEEAGAADLVQSFEKCRNGLNVLLNVSSYKGEYSTLLHGDCWSNNFMFKYETDDDTKKLKDLRILDWQIVHLGTPVYDLSYFLYSNACKSIFDNLDYYLDVYYKSFSKMTIYLGHEPETIYPFHALKAEWKQYSMYGFLLGLLLQKNKLTYDDEIVDLNDLKDFQNDNELFQRAIEAKYDRKVYTERVVNLVKHMSEIGVL